MKISKLQTDEQLDSIVIGPVSKQDLLNYANASGDFNPIHLDEEEAKNAGLPGIIAHGMWTMGNLSKLFSPYYEEGFLEDFSIRFRGMVFLNDKVTLTARLEKKIENQLYFLVTAKNQDDADVLKGKVIYKLYQS